MSLIHLIAPSGYAINQQAALRGVARLEQAGHAVENQRVITRRQQRFAGSDAERAADLNDLAQLAGPDTIVMPVRGGYGATRLLDQIDWQALCRRQQRSPLLICGHSDFTAVQMALLSRGNVITFSGPMLTGNFGAETLNDFTVEHFWRALRHPQFTVEWQSSGPQCDVEGTLWGGNLAMLTSLVGTPWLPQIDGGILVVEDVNEHPFRVERMLLQLFHAGILSRQRALVLGSFSGRGAKRLRCRIRFADGRGVPALAAGDPGDRRAGFWPRTAHRDPAAGGPRPADKSARSGNADPERTSGAGGIKKFAIMLINPLFTHAYVLTS
ncbi:Murein tetrapeptide carboxypeptidase [Pluralibacter gergoviae]|nr:Murein tetrapeptide carboxypeptidase [Pluralibacter gergoviae]